MAELVAGVAGAGVFGGFHARKLSRMAGVRLARVFDSHGDRAQALADETGAHVANDADAFLEGLDLVVLATPADAHAVLGLKALRAGAHLYVEKPLATSLADADALLAAAAGADRVLACGHQERVVFAAMGLLDAAEPPLQLASVRRGTPNVRNRDVSCVLDLMIHDLDLALLMARSEAVAVEAEGAFDAVRAEVTFASGLSAVFEASREASARERTMTVDFASGTVEVDFLAPSFVNGSAVALKAAFAADPAACDPLGASLAAFVAAARGEGTPVADGRAGAAALDLALAVELAAGL